MTAPLAGARHAAIATRATAAASHGAVQSRRPAWRDWCTWRERVCAPHSSDPAAHGTPPPHLASLRDSITHARRCWGEQARVACCMLPRRACAQPRERSAAPRRRGRAHDSGPSRPLAPTTHIVWHKRTCAARTDPARRGTLSNGKSCPASSGDGCDVGGQSQPNSQHKARCSNTHTVLVVVYSSDTHWSRLTSSVLCHTSQLSTPEVTCACQCAR